MSQIHSRSGSDNTQTQVEVEANDDNEVVDVDMNAEAGDADAASKENNKEAVREEGPFAFSDPSIIIINLSHLTHLVIINRLISSLASASIHHSLNFNCHLMTRKTSSRWKKQCLQSPYCFSQEYIPLLCDHHWLGQNNNTSNIPYKEQHQSTTAVQQHLSSPHVVLTTMVEHHGCRKQLLVSLMRLLCT